MTISNVDGEPFDEKQAEYFANILSRETGRAYRLEPFQSGFSIVSIASAGELDSRESNDAPAIFLKPAIQSQVWNVLIIGLLLVVYSSMEALMTTFGIDQLHTTLFDLFGKTFSWELAVILSKNTVLIGAFILSISVIYNLISRSYMIGPKGVETSVGLFNKDEMRVEFKHVRGMRVKRTIIQRLLFYGTIEIATSGTEGSEIQFRNIARPKKYIALLKERTIRI